MCRIAATNKNDEEPKLEWQDAATMGTPSLFEWPDMVSFSSAVFDAPCRAFLRDYLFSPRCIFCIENRISVRNTVTHILTTDLLTKRESYRASREAKKQAKKQRKMIRRKAQVSKMSEWRSNAKGTAIQRKQTKPCSYPTSDASQQHTLIRQNRTENKSAPQCRRTPMSKKRRKVPASSKTLIFQGPPAIPPFPRRKGCRDKQNL